MNDIFKAIGEWHGCSFGIRGLAAIFPKQLKECVERFHVPYNLDARYGVEAHAVWRWPCGGLLVVVMLLRRVPVATTMEGGMVCGLDCS